MSTECTLSRVATLLLASVAVGAEAEDPVAVVAAFPAALSQNQEAAALSLLTSDTRIFESGHAETREEYAAHHGMD